MSKSRMVVENHENKVLEVVAKFEHLFFSRHMHAFSKRLGSAQEKLAKIRKDEDMVMIKSPD